MGEFTLTNALIGAAGGLAGVLVKCGGIELPYRENRMIYLGSLSGVFLGGIAGCVGDHDPVNVLMWGIGGTAIIQGLANAASKIKFK